MFKERFKNILSLMINAFLFWFLWFLLTNLLGYIEWGYINKSLNFIEFWWHNGIEGSMAFGIFSVLISFPLAFFIVKKLKIKF